MGRLTIKKEDGSYTFDQAASQLPLIMQKLGEMEDAEEQGLLPRFHLGDEFWTIRLGKVLKAKVVMLQQKKDGSWQYRFSQEITPEYHDTHNYKESEFGKRFFLTKEEAEQALARMEKSND